MPRALASVWIAALLAGDAVGARVSGSHGAAVGGASGADAAGSVGAAVESPAALAGEGNSHAGASAALGGLSVTSVPGLEPRGPEFKTPSLASLERGQAGQALVPSLVPPPGAVYQVRNSKNSLATEYKWELDKIEYGGREHEIDSTWSHMYGRSKSMFAQLRGKWQSSSFGHKSLHAYDNSGKELFKIRASKNVWNPLQRRFSFRILPPDSKDNKDALFTINKDQIGGRWRIYRGRERDEDMIYYGVSDSWPGWDVKFYKSTDESDPPVATIGWGGTKWKLELKIQAGEDSALLLAVSTIMYMAREGD